MAERNGAVEARSLAVDLSGRRVLDGVSLDFAAGEVTVILGPNGAGKSTLLRALGALVPHTGSVRYGAIDSRALSPRERALRVAYVPQQTELQAALAVRDVVALGRFAHGARLGRLAGDDERAVRNAIAACDLEELAGRSFLRLSGGEQRRVLIARALASEAAIALADEPTAGLDVRHVLDAHRLLRRMADAGRAVVVVLHDLDDARVFGDRAVLLDRGRVVAQGTPAEVVSQRFAGAVYSVALHERSGLRFGEPGEAPPC